MPRWSNQPPQEHAGHSLRLRRTPGPGQIQGIVTTADVLGCITHYWQHRTIPCEEERCEACDAGQAWRWHGYVAAIDPRTAEHYVFEFTAQAAEHFTEYRRLHGSLLGCHFQATRLGDRPNGRVLLRLKTADLATIRLPNPPDLPAILTQIWGLAKTQCTQTDRLKDAPRIRVHSEPTADTTERPVYNTPGTTDSLEGRHHPLHHNRNGE